MICLECSTSNEEQDESNACIRCGTNLDASRVNYLLFKAETGLTDGNPTLAGEYLGRAVKLMRAVDSRTQHYYLLIARRAWLRAAFRRYNATEMRGRKGRRGRTAEPSFQIDKADEVVSRSESASNPPAKEQNQTPPPTRFGWMSINEAAAMLGVGSGPVRRAAEMGKVISKKHPYGLQVEIGEVAAYLATTPAFARLSSWEGEKT